MISKKLIKPIIYILIVSFFASCSTTYEVTRRSEFTLPDDLGNLTVYLKNGKKVKLEHFVLKDNTLQSIDNSINLNDVKKIESTQSHTGLTIVTIAIGAAVLIPFLAFLNKEKNLNNGVIITYPSGGMGCLASLNNDIRPIAGGQTNLINIGLIDFRKLDYINVIGKEDTLHVGVKQLDENEFELIEETCPKSDNLKTSLLEFNLDNLKR